MGEKMTVQTIVTPESNRFSVLEAPLPAVKTMKTDKNISKKALTDKPDNSEALTKIEKKF